MPSGIRSRFDLADAEWERLAELIPVPELGRRSWQLRAQFNGIMWRFRCGAPWREVPERYGNWNTIYGRFCTWRDDGTRARLLEAVLTDAQARGQIDWRTVSVDSTTNRAHQHAAGALFEQATLEAFEESLADVGGKKGGRKRGRTTPESDGVGDWAEGGDPAVVGSAAESAQAGDPQEEAHRAARRRRRARLAAAGLGRSRGGLTTKVHLAADGRCRPLSVKVTAGQHGDSPEFTAVLERIAVRDPRGGPARCRPEAVPADKAYSAKANRAYLRRRGIKAVIPEKTDQAATRKRKGSKGGRPVGHDAELYKARNKPGCYWPVS